MVLVRRLSAITDLFGPLRLGYSCIACGGLLRAELVAGICSGTHILRPLLGTLVRLTRIMCHQKHFELVCVYAICTGS